MNIVYITQHFSPEPGAPSARVLEMARVWARAGHTVKVVTVFPNHPHGVIHPEYRGHRFMKEEIDGVEVYRNWVYATPNDGIIKRTLGHLSFMLSAVVQTLPVIGEVDVIIVTSPPFFAAIAGYIFGLVKRKPFLFEVRDLWPSIFLQLGVLKNTFIIRTLELLEMFLYRRASRIITVTDSVVNLLVNRGIPAEKIDTITNGVDLEFYVPGPKENAVREELGLQGKFVALYIGTHGISQGLEDLVEAADRLREDKDMVFLFVGEGARKKRLVQLAEEKGLTNVMFLEGQTKDRMPAFYQAADVCFVPLRNIELFEKTIPSKIFEIMGCARPILGSVAGEVRGILEQAGGSVLTSPQDVDGIVKAIQTLKADPRRESLGLMNRAFAAKFYSRTDLAKRYLDILRSVSSGWRKPRVLPEREPTAFDALHQHAG